ncbi:MAG TPA: PA14 domain-containing protein, partial [Candidatus Methylacidiphilales bacterium]
EGGRYYEELFSKAAQAGADRLFVGMFDEYDEGTAIMPMSDDPPPTPQEPGTVVKFFADPKMQEQPVTVNKPEVEQSFDGTPPAKNMPLENYLMRWEGQIIPPADGTYSLEIEGAPGDTWSLWIAGKQVLKIDHPDTAAAKTASVAWTAGQRVIYRIDYLHGTAPGAMRFVWQGPSIDRQEIPASALVDAWGRFVTNEGRPPDWYLKLTSEAKEMVTGQRPPTDLTVK